MYLEERVDSLEKENQELRQRIESLEHRGADRFVSVKELAEIMGCSLNIVYSKIQEGEIYATRKTGAHKIPLSQFYMADTPIIKQKNPKKALPKNMKELVFGSGG